MATPNLVGNLVPGKGDGSGLTNLSGASVTGTIPASAVPPFTSAADFRGGFASSLGFSTTCQASEMLSLADSASATLASAAWSRWNIVEFETLNVGVELRVVNGTVSIVWQSAGTKFSTTSGNAGTINVSCSGTTVTVENKTGGHITLGGEIVRHI